MVASHCYDAAKADLDRHLDKDLSDDERAAASRAVDLDAEETTCPACLTTISPKDLRCPECGLRFGA